MRSKYMDSLSDPHFAAALVGSRVETADEAWRGVIRHPETGKIVGYYCDVEDMIA